MRNVPANIRAELARADRSVLEAADLLDIAMSTWYRRMGKPRTWPLGDLADLAEWLGIPLVRLFVNVAER